jgi:hypothetical protein
VEANFGRRDGWPASTARNGCATREEPWSAIPPRFTKSVAYKRVTAETPVSVAFARVITPVFAILTVALQTD